jgi:hypothetical protein
MSRVVCWNLACIVDIEGSKDVRELYVELLLALVQVDVSRLQLTLLVLLSPRPGVPIVTFA